MMRPTLLLAVALAVTGCAARVAPVDLTPTEQVHELRLPFDAYSFSLAELYTIANAEDVLTGECMRGKGLPWSVIVRPTDLKDSRNRRRYGVIEPVIARSFGYHVPAGLLTPAQVEEEYDSRDSALSEEQKQAAFSEGGCGPEAVGQLRPAVSEDPGMLQKLSRESLDTSPAEPGVAEAMRAWRGCVREMGFSYEDPFAAMSDARWWADEAGGPSRDEIAVAVADVRCKERTGLIAVWHAAEVLIQREAVTRNLEYFQKLGAAMEAELTAAHAVLART